MPALKPKSHTHARTHTHTHTHTHKSLGLECVCVCLVGAQVTHSSPFSHMQCEAVDNTEQLHIFTRAFHELMETADMLHYRTTGASSEKLLRQSRAQ